MNGLYRTALALRSHERSLDSIATNLANLGTSGFKRVRTAQHAFEVPHSLSRTGTATDLRVTSRVDFGQGDLNRTGRPLDLALYGEGFFTVEGPQGELYTRQGSFHTTATGALVTDEGLPVAWDTLSAPIDPTGLPVEIDGEGTVRQAGAELGRLRITGFADAEALQLDRSGFWHAPRGAERAAHSAVVHQGALEESNSVGVEELVALVDVQRSFEAVAGVMSKIEDTYNTLTQSF